MANNGNVGISKPAGSCLYINGSYSSIPSQRNICTFAFVDGFNGLSVERGVYKEIHFLKKKKLTNKNGIKL